MKSHPLVWNCTPEIVEKGGKFCRWQDIPDHQFTTLMPEKAKKELAEFRGPPPQKSRQNF